MKNRLKEAIVGDDTMNYSYYEGKEIDVNAVISTAETMPFFAPRRLIILENSGLFKKDAEALASYLPELPETTHMIFVEKEIDKRNRLYKKVTTLGYAAECKKRSTGGIKALGGPRLRGFREEDYGSDDGAVSDEDGR